MWYCNALLLKKTFHNTGPNIQGLFTPGHLMRFLWSHSYLIVKRPGVSSLWNAFETDLNPNAQTTSAGGLGCIPEETGQV